MADISAHDHSSDIEQIPATERLRRVGLRPTRQRVALADILFSKGARHVSAEILHEEALIANVPVSLATVYNTLHQFTEVGMLREIVVDSSKTYFDTKVHHHHHFYDEDLNEVRDIPGTELRLQALPEIQQDMEISRIDVVVRVRRKRH